MTSRMQNKFININYYKSDRYMYKLSMTKFKCIWGCVNGWLTTGSLACLGLCLWLRDAD